VENSPLLVRRGLAVVLGDLAAMGYDAAWCVLGAADAGAPHERERIWIVANARCKLRQPWRDDKAGESPQRTQQADFDKRCGQDVADSTSQRQSTSGDQGEHGKTSSTWQANQLGSGSEVSDSNSAQRERGSLSSGVRPQDADASGPGWWGTEPELGRVAYGVANRVDRLKAIGNGQVPAVAAAAWRELIGSK
jgi:DNA (cytosine-5)-methyltransferase 1